MTAAWGRQAEISSVSGRLYYRWSIDVFIALRRHKIQLTIFNCFMLVLAILNLSPRCDVDALSRETARPKAVVHRVVHSTEDR